MLKDYLVRCGLTEQAAKDAFYLVDSKGLVAMNRRDHPPQAHKVALARTDMATPRLETLADVIDYVKPTALLGLSTTGGAFTKEIITEMGNLNKSPIIFRIPSSLTAANLQH
jgi:malate dehydrogenase (oxaloacetate-decarboxylating)(NADP+)